ncbi:MAG: hypothetical protein M1820_006994 [Bogoriella megaspora]|nr:MAG: hypothetical protein M1820_006994 [Bogoriella megaspora]
MAPGIVNQSSNKLQRTDTAGTNTQADGASTKLSKDSPTVSSPSDYPGDSPQQLPGHQRFVLTDPVAFRYLEEDPSTTVLKRRHRLQGYEIYVVEQWACSRTQPTFVITTYTGDPSHSIIVGVLSVPTDEDTWSPRLKVYFKALNQYHARRKETPLGFLTVTNLSGFPSSLTVVPVPNGDIKAHRDDFFVNEDLKRLGCSGRVGLTLAPPTGATQSKFHQLYRTSEKVPIYTAVTELVKLCQVALVLFGKLEQEYADGLLCDVTERAINDWWVEVGTEFYNVEPSDGILGPTTVAALLGMLIGARNRLHAYGAPVAKDVFYTESTKRGIAYFQKSQRLSKTRRLDRQTLDKLHKATAKAASSEGWTVPRAVKSTMAEISGKGGEMMMEFVGGRDKAGIAEVETVDIERFVQLVHGERSKWLWYGKPMKSQGDMFSRLPGEEGLVFEPDEQGGYSWTGRRKDSTVPDRAPLKRNTGSFHGKVPKDGVLEAMNEKDPDLKKAVLKRAGGRLKGAVGLKTHHGKHAHEDAIDDPSQLARNDSQLSVAPSLHRTNSAPASPESVKSVEEPLDSLAKTANGEPKASPAFAKVLTETPEVSQTALAEDKDANGDANGYAGKDTTLGPPFQYDTSKSSQEPSIAGSTYHGTDLDDLLPTDTLPGQDTGPLLRRTQSTSGLSLRNPTPRNETSYPRCLSFSIAEPSILVWDDLVGPSATTHSASSSSRPDPYSTLTYERSIAVSEKRTRADLSFISGTVSAWVSGKISHLQSLEIQADRDHQELQTLYYPRYESYRALAEQVKGVLEAEQTLLQEGVKEVETLSAKLEYEINNLRSRVEDVEEGVKEFTSQVEGVEERVVELEADSREKPGWGTWMWSMVTGRGGG